MKHYNIPIFISHYGCPNMCVFCNQNKITGRETDIEPKEVSEIIDIYLKTLPKNCKKEVAFFGGTFTAISLPLQRKFLNKVKKYIDKGLLDGIRLSTRPDNINREILDTLVSYGVTTIELGVQSLDNKVLELSERGYQKEEVVRASSLIKEYGIKLGIQVMPGLPGSSFESDIKTIEDVIKIKPDFTRVYPTLVISDTKLEELYNKKKFEPLSIDDAVKLTGVIISKLELEAIDIIRVGLQPSDDIRAEGVVIDGPFHPAFRELVESELYRSFFENLLLKSTKLEIVINKYDVSKASGMKRFNKVYFGKKISIIVDNNMKMGDMFINGRRYSRKDLLENYTKSGAR